MISGRASTLSDSVGPEYIMLGAGGHARVLQEILALDGVTLHGYLAPNATPSRLGDAPYLGNDESLKNLDPATVLLVNGIGSASAPTLRRQVFLGAKERGFRFLSVIDHSAIVRPSAQLGEGVQVLPGAIVGCDATVGNNVILNSGAVIDHDTRLGAHSHVSPGAVLAGDVSIGETSHIGLGARVIQRVSIGSDCVVGAGAVVLRDVPDKSVAVGVPATVRANVCHR